MAAAWGRAAAILVAGLMLAVPSLAQTVGSSGLPVPRFVSLKSDSVNVRQGPSRDQAVIWRYVRAGMPVEITQEGLRQVQVNRDGKSGQDEMAGVTRNVGRAGFVDVAEKHG